MAFIIEIISIIKIILSPFLFFSFLGLFYYINYPNENDKLIACCISFIGLIVGIFWVYRIKKKNSVEDYINNISN